MCSRYLVTVVLLHDLVAEHMPLQLLYRLSVVGFVFAVNLQSLMMPIRVAIHQQQNPALVVNWQLWLMP
uniref:Uncharacterized protein n=1 Tax=Panstrongylus lignarius TaxID=156445 RepID=A0A224Y6W7_9HEMI